MNVLAPMLDPDAEQADPESVAPVDETAERALEAALRWLRLRLKRLADGAEAAADDALEDAAEAEAPEPVDATPPAHAVAPNVSRSERPGCLRFWRARPRRARSPVATPPRPAPEPDPAIAPPTPPRRPLIPSPDESLAEAAAAMHEALEARPRPPLAKLVEAFHLSRHERNTLLLAAAPEIDPSMGAAIASAAKAVGLGDEPRPTFGLALRLFGDWGVLDPDGPLRRLKFLEIHQPSGQTLVAATLRADERIVHFLKGINRLDDRLDLWLTSVPPPEAAVSLPHSQARVAQAMLRAVDAGAGSTLIQLLGNDGASKLLVTSHVAQARERVLYRLAADALPNRLSELADFARLWERDSRLLRLALIIDAREVDPESSSASVQALERLLERLHGGLIVLDTREPRSFPRQPALTIDVYRPLPLEQRTAWLRELATIPRSDVERESGSNEYACESPRPDTKDQMIARMLASQFNLNIPTIHDLVQAVAYEFADQEPNASGLYLRLWCACLAVARPRLDALARRLEPAPRGVDVILPQPGRDLLDQIVAQVKNRGRVLDDWGFRRLLRAAKASASCSPARAAPGRRLPQKSWRTDSSSTFTASTSPQLYPSMSVRLRRTCGGCSTRPRTAASFCSSTRPTLYSAVAPRSRTATTATRTSRSTTCCNASKPSAD